MTKREKEVPNKNKYSSIDDIFSDDDFHLIEEKKKVSNSRTADERLLDSFEEIQKFVDEQGKEPEPNTNNITEFRLYSRLKSLKESPEKIEQLNSHDRNSLLGLSASQVEDESIEYIQKKPESLDDILDDDDINLIEDDDEGLFEFKHVPKETDRASADFVARRKPCPDFDRYDLMFQKVQKDLAEGKRKLISFKQDILKPDTYYVHNGILLYLEAVDFEEKNEAFDSGERTRVDGRTKVVFENGTQSNMLYRSLYKQLLKNGRAVTENNEKVNEEFIEKFSNISDEDEEAGYIYVLKSKSSDPEIANKNNLYKIGYSKNDVANRIKNAERDPTYLMAPVEYVAGWKCYNMNPQKFEQLIHNFFGNSCLEVDVFDEKGKRHTPREWFIASLGIIEQAIQLIITGEITNYSYDNESKLIKSR